MVSRLNQNKETQNTKQIPYPNPKYNIWNIRQIM